MDELIEIQDLLLDRYEETVLRRENLRKKAREYDRAYAALFGDLMIQAFELKVECIRKKKTISYCQRQVNQGKKIDVAAMETFIEREMSSYQDQLEDLVKGVGAARGGREISPQDLRKIKKLYYELVKKIHPDLHPDLARDPVLSEYWNRIADAYQRNDLEDLEEMRDLTDLYLRTHGVGGGSVPTENLEQKIEAVETDISEILSTNPYLLRLILDDDQAVAEKKREYRDEITSYTAYSKELDEVLAGFQTERTLS